MALSCDPMLLIADEPTTALDVTIQAQILDLAKRLRAQLGMAMIWITHDLGVVAGLADRLIVMYGGFIVESDGVDAIFARPLHPYTKALMRALPNPDQRSSHRLEPIGGMPPQFDHPPAGCPFAPWRDRGPSRPAWDRPGVRFATRPTSGREREAPPVRRTALAA